MDTNEIRAITRPFARRVTARAYLLEALPRIISEHGRFWWQNPLLYRHFISGPVRAGVLEVREAAHCINGDLDAVRQGL